MAWQNKMEGGRVWLLSTNCNCQVWVLCMVLLSQSQLVIWRERKGPKDVAFDVVFRRTVYLEQKIHLLTPCSTTTEVRSKPSQRQDAGKHVLFQTASQAKNSTKFTQVLDPSHRRSRKWRETTRNLQTGGSCDPIEKHFAAAAGGNNTDTHCEILAVEYSFLPF